MGNVRIENSDSKTYTISIKVSGSSSTISIAGSTTATYSWSGGSHDATVTGGGVDFPSDTIKDGGRYKISGGRAVSN